MADSEKLARWGEGIIITAPQLHTLEFRRESQEDSTSTEYETEFILGLNRFGFLRLGVEFGVTVEGIEGLHAQTTFRMVFTLKPESPEAKDPVKAFQGVAARLAPVAMYPWVRETLASIAMKAGVPNLVLPIRNVGGLWNPAEIEIPDAEDDGEQNGHGQEDFELPS